MLLLTDNSPSREANPDAVYLAQRSQTGNGNTQTKQRAANPADSPLAAMNDGTPDGNSIRFSQALSGSASAEVIASRAERSALAYQNGTDLPTSSNESPLALSPTPPNPITTSLIDDELRLRGASSREALITPDTRESRMAPYLDSNLKIDQAALSILKRAAPFDPFPPGMRQDYDQLRFAYEWQFLEN